MIPSKPIIPLRTSPKKSKKRQAKTLLLQIRCTPIALPAPRPEPLIFRVPPLCLIFDPKPIIPLRTSLKKSKKRQAKTSLLKIRCTPIALAALAALVAAVAAVERCECCGGCGCCGCSTADFTNPMFKQYIHSSLYKPYVQTVHPRGVPPMIRPKNANSVLGNAIFQ